MENFNPRYEFELWSIIRFNYYLKFFSFLIFCGFYVWVTQCDAVNAELSRLRAQFDPRNQHSYFIELKFKKHTVHFRIYSHIFAILLATLTLIISIYSWKILYLPSKTNISLFHYQPDNTLCMLRNFNRAIFINSLIYFWNK